MNRSDSVDAIASATQAMMDAGRLFHSRGWVPATGGNFSVRLDDQLLITASGGHKGELTSQDFLIADSDGRPLDSARKASYETGLHVQLYRHDPTIRCVLHTHSIANTVLSRRLQSVMLEGYELLKILPGIGTHQVRVEIPVFENDQDIARLATTVDQRLQQAPAYLIAGHGLYAWGESVAQARHRVEALEFMFECALHEMELAR